MKARDKCEKRAMVVLKKGEKLGVKMDSGNGLNKLN
jgi:hypothetical protein